MLKNFILSIIFQLPKIFGGSVHGLFRNQPNDLRARDLNVESFDFFSHGFVSLRQAGGLVVHQVH